jgi:hypothetical protein
MKQVSLLIVSLISMIGSAQANSLICTMGGYAYEANYQLAVPERINGRCDQGYTFEISGAGAGLRIGAAVMSITCPFVEDFRGTYYGVKAGGGFALAFEGGAYMGAGLCVVTGIEFGIGAGVSFGTLKIENTSMPKTVEQKISEQPKTAEEEPITEKKFELDRQ